MGQSVKMFFQVILPRTLQLGKLEIPQHFVHLYGEKFLFGDSIILAAPNGDTWPMSLEKTGSVVTIGGDGWTEFAKHYSVGAMDFIMFRYKCHQKSIPVFNVIILNESTSMEIPHYPTKHRPTLTSRRAKSNGIAASFEKCQSIHTAGRRYLGIPIPFLRKAGLCNKTKLLLKGETGVEREVKLKHRTRVSRGKHGGSVEHKRYHLGCGWKAFREDNDIANTDKLKFQHISGRLIAVTKVV